MMKYQQERGIAEHRIADVCNRIIKQGGTIFQILPHYSCNLMTYIIIYTI